MKLNIGTVVNNPVVKVVVVALLIAVGVLLEHGLAAVDVKVPYVIVLPVAVICCDLYGFRASAIAAVIGVVIALYQFIDPLASFGLPAIGDAIQLFAFLGITLFVCWVLGLYRGSVQSLENQVKKLGDASPEKG